MLRSLLIGFFVSTSAIAAMPQGIGREAPEKIAANPPKGRAIIVGADATQGEGRITYQIRCMADDALAGKALAVAVKDTTSVEAVNPTTGKKERKDQVKVSLVPLAIQRDGRERFSLPPIQSKDSRLVLFISTGGDNPPALSNTLELFPRGGTWALREAGDVGKIANACPEKATATPAKPRKLLVYTKALGFVHDSIPIGARAIQLTGQKTGAWETVISDDAYMFEPETLNQFDAVMMMSTTGELFGISDKATNDRLRKSLLEFVASGHGLAGSHAATDCSYQWKEYGDMIGGYFNGHPFGSIHVKLDDPTSPIDAVFGGKDFDFHDEIYTFRDPYSRKKLHVLLSIDMPRTKLADDPKRPGFKQGENRADHDYALSWIKPYGQGRVFYCAFGHVHETFWNKMALQHFCDGLQYAIGDLKADATPSEKGPVAADFEPQMNADQRR